MVVGDNTAEVDYAELLERATADADSVTAPASELIRIPSRAGVDAYEPVLTATEEWARAKQLPLRRLRGSDGTAVGLLVEVAGAMPGPTWILNACLDTAPFGDESAWSFPPTAGDVVSGSLRGRGAADSKTAAAMFCHIAAAVREQTSGLAGTLVVLLDVDEHTGDFGGATAALNALEPSSIAGAMIGYPGYDEIIVGGRGVFRARLTVYGTAVHTGSSRPGAVNAASRAAWLVTMLDELPLPTVAANGFPVPPKLTVTGLHSGQGFSVVPDEATVAVDVRLTDVLDAPRAEKLVRSAMAQLDAAIPAPKATEMEVALSWPHYQVRPTQQPAAALLAATRLAGLDVRTRVAGPSNIGNLLAEHGISTTAGFGLPYTGLHGIDEQVELNALPSVQAIYHHGVLSLMATQRDESGR